MAARIKAIETQYAGCRFRSRLEARWAVFWDTLEWPWEYEPQGFALPSGNYLPDFRVHVPDSSNGPVWFEVKPPGVPDDPRWPELAAMTDAMIIVAKGMHRSGDSCRSAHTADAYSGTAVGRDLKLWMHSPAAAWDAASGARFEHGESPVTRRGRRKR